MAYDTNHLLTVGHAKQVYDNLKSAKVNIPESNPYGTEGMVLQTKGDGTTEWVDVAGINPALSNDNLLQYAVANWSENNEHRIVSVNANGSLNVWTDGGANVLIYYWNSSSNLPDWIIPGCTYRMKYHAPRLSGAIEYSLAVRIYVYQDGNTTTSTRIYISTEDGTFKIPANTTGILFRMQKDAGEPLNIVVKPELYLLNAQSDIVKYYDADITDVPQDVVQWQDFTQVGDELWLISGSTDNISPNGYIYRLDAETYEYIGSITHNLGHCNSVDYDSSLNALVVQSGQDNDSNLYIYHDVSSWATLQTVDFATVDKAVIDLSGLGTGISYASSCWGEKKRNGYRYIYIANNIGVNWIKIDPSAENDKYTGDYSLVWTKTCVGGVIDGVNTSRVLQGMTMYHGVIYASISHNPIFGAAFTVSGSEMSREIIHVDGTGLSNVNEGCAVVNGTLLLGVSSEKIIAHVPIN